MPKNMEKIFTYKNRVYFGDTDAAAVVYHAKYIYWLEAARIELLDAINYPYKTLQDKKIGFIPTHIDINYHAPLRFSEYFKIETSFLTIKTASFILDCYIKKGSDLICSAKVKLACINEITWKPMKLPKDFIDALNR